MHQLLSHTVLFADSACSTGIMGPHTPGLYDGLCSGTNVAITSLDQTLVLVSNVIRILLWLSGSLGVLFIIIGGIYYVTAAGNPAALKRAKEIISNVITGLVIVIIAYAVVTFISGGFN